MLGVKSVKANNNVVDLNGQCDVVASDLYVSQLRNFIAKNSTTSFACHKQHHSQVDKQPHRTYSLHSSEAKNQHTDFKRKCKQAVYKFMKGLLDERKLTKIKSLSKVEPIYFEVSIFLRTVVYYYIIAITNGRWKLNLTN